MVISMLRSARHCWKVSHITSERTRRLTTGRTISRKKRSTMSAGFSSMATKLRGGVKRNESGLRRRIHLHPPTRAGMSEYQPEPNAAAELDGNRKECLRQGGD